MNTFSQTHKVVRRLRPLALGVAAALMVGGCAVSSSGGISGGGMSGGGGMPGGGMPGGMPGGSSGGGMPGGSSGGGMPGGSSGGGMPGGSSGGGMSGGSSGGGGMSGGGGGGGGMAGGGVRGLGGQMPGGVGGVSGTGGASGTGENCNGQDLPGGVGGMEQSGGCSGDVGGQYPGETPEQRKARLEKKLDKSVGGFDGVLAGEQKEISTVSRDTKGFGGERGGGGGVGLGKQASGGVQGTGEVAHTDEDETATTPSVAGLSEEEIKRRTPEDIPDMVTEDIVAKQLREAALAEDDPKLRERLWDEYRKYNDL